jgi:hypothetical protein
LHGFFLWKRQLESRGILLVLAIGPSLKLKAILHLSAVIIGRILGQEGDLLLREQLDLLAGGFELFEGVVTAEVLSDEELKAVLDFALLG